MRKVLAFMWLILPLVTNAQRVVNLRVIQPAEFGFSASWQDTTVVAGDPLTLGTNLSVFGGSGEYSYRWSPVADLSDSTIIQPVATPVDTTTYLLTVTDKNGCSFEVEYKVNVALPSVNVGLKTGWNIFSFPVMPANPDVKAVSQGLISDGSMVRIQDETGNTLEDMGAFGGWVNTIGNLSLSDGYKVKVTRNCQLNVRGVPVRLPFRIPLKQGWNIIGFPRSAEAEALGVVQQLIDRGTLVKVQDEQGFSIEDFGPFGSWTNDIGIFTPGKGFKIRVSTADTLTIFESYPKSATQIRENPNPAIHFIPIMAGNGWAHMNIHLVGLPEGFLEEGDEVAIFDGSLCLGAVRLMPWHIARRSISIPVSARDGDETPGFTVGTRFSVKAWRSAADEEFPLEAEIIKGGATFQKQESTFLSLAKYAATGTGDNSALSEMKGLLFPNPNDGKFKLQILGPPSGKLEVIVTDMSGRVLINKPVVNFCGNLTETFMMQLPSGIYSVKVVSDVSKTHQTFIIQ
jgi:hypothetical protein